MLATLPVARCKRFNLLLEALLRSVRSFNRTVSGSAGLRLKHFRAAQAR